MRTALFINANSRGARDLIGQVKADFKQNPGRFDIVDTIVVGKLSRFAKALKRLQAIDKLDCVIVGSGDGTIIAVINAMKDRGVVFAFLPLGTVNAFVRSIGLPGSYEEAFTTLQRSRSRTISLGEVNGVLFANIAAIGISARIAGSISDKTKRFLGPLAYVLTSLRELAAHKAFSCTVVLDGKTRHFKTHQLVIANGRYHGYHPIGKVASVFKDQLVLAIFGNDPIKRHYLSSMARFLLKRHEQHEYTELLPFSTATIVTKPKRAIEADGEVIGRTPAEFHVVPRAIQVLSSRKKPAGNK